MILLRLFFVLLLSCLTQSDTLLKPQEIEIFSFSTKKGKQVLVAREKNDKYLVYRFGKNGKVELEFPANKVDSWNQFIYSGYSRPPQDSLVGVENHQLSFRNGNFQYTLYQSEFIHDQRDMELGIQVTDVKTGKTTDIKGVVSTLRGTLSFFRDNELIKKDD